MAPTGHPKPMGSSTAWRGSCSASGLQSCSRSEAPHIILTRFSMRASFGFGDEPFPLSWLEERVELLENYALGGMREQTAKEFDWLLLCDESTDSSCLARLAGLARDVPQ